MRVALTGEPIQHAAGADVWEPAFFGAFHDKLVAFLCRGQIAGEVGPLRIWGDMRVALTGHLEDEHAVGFEGGEPFLRDAHGVDAPGGTADQLGADMRVARAKQGGEEGFFGGRVKAADEAVLGAGVLGALCCRSKHIRWSVARAEHGDLFAIQESGIADHTERLAFVCGMLDELPRIHADVFRDAFFRLGRAHDHFVIIAVPDTDGVGWGHKWNDMRVVPTADAAGCGGFECADDMPQFGWTFSDADQSMEMIRHHHEFAREHIIAQFPATLPFLRDNLPYGRHACRL